MSLHASANSLGTQGKQIGYASTGVRSDDLGKKEEVSQETKYTLEQRLQILTAFVIFLNTWGLLLAFGVFQTYYELDLLRDKSSSEISWILTTCAFLVLFSGAVTGSLFDRGLYKYLFVGGSLLQTLGIMMLSISKVYYQVFLSQAVCVGLGGGLLYIPGIAAAASSFNERDRPKVLGLVAAGSGIGGTIYPIVFRRLLSQIGFGWTVRTIGFIVFVLYILSWGTLRFEARRSAQVRRWIDWSAFKEPPFVSLMLGSFLSSISYYLPLLYLPLYAQTALPNFHNTDLAFYLLAIVNGVSVPGRIIAGLIAVKYGPLQTCTAGVIGCAIVLFAWAAVKSTAGLIVWSVFWGLSSGVIIAMPGAYIPLFCPSMEVVGTRIGMYWMNSAIGILIGGPIGGSLVNVKSTDIRWWRLQVLSGCFMVGTILCVIIPLWTLRKRSRRASTQSDSTYAMDQVKETSTVE